MSTKRGGAVVATGRKVPWLKYWHDEILGSPGYQMLDFEVAGAWHRLDLIARRSQDDGALRMETGSRMVKRQVIELLATIAARSVSRRSEKMAWAKDALQAMVDGGLVVVGRDQEVFIARYLDQQTWVSPAAQRKQDQRERDRGRDMENTGGGDPSYPIEEHPAARAPSSPSPLTGKEPTPALTVTRRPSDAAGSDVGVVRDSHVTDTTRSQSPESRSQNGETRTQRSEPFREAASQTQPPTSDFRRGEGEEGARAGSQNQGQHGDVVDVYAMQPIEAGCFVALSRGKQIAATARMALRLLGDARYWACVAEVHRSNVDGITKNAQRLFTHVCKEAVGPDVWEADIASRAEPRRGIGFQHAAPPARPEPSVRPMAEVFGKQGGAPAKAVVESPSLRSVREWQARDAQWKAEKATIDSRLAGECDRVVSAAVAAGLCSSSAEIRIEDASP